MSMKKSLVLAVVLFAAVGAAVADDVVVIRESAEIQAPYEGVPLEMLTQDFSWMSFDWAHFAQPSKARCARANACPIIMIGDAGNKV